ncbi:uncharacterized protein N7515_000798 [Penicillium bovifimosum]|uniref:Uncharacterized protein n=1 Tax=Penicillium bovifimosum TaxID=126998 RepID=A0A9W9HFP3_9EURO|nr:uncharacterized protein N7515_000798 [Penicillium bovifimosum]KAJ5146234.1 hypothetical protein N7515_000798 [Penicillium bovifimosum]
MSSCFTGLSLGTLEDICATAREISFILIHHRKQLPLNPTIVILDLNRIPPQISGDPTPLQHLARNPIAIAAVIDRIAPPTSIFATSQPLMQIEFWAAYEGGTGDSNSSSGSLLKWEILPSQH